MKLHYYAETDSLYIELRDGAGVEVREIADLCRDHGAVLATGHTTAAEHVAVAREYGRRQKVLVTHATSPSCRTTTSRSVLGTARA